jgi:hypothetical protein
MNLNSGVELYDCWRLAGISWWYYVLTCLGIAVVERLMFAAFRARAVQMGDFPGAVDDPSDLRCNVIPGFWKAFRTIICGFKRQREHSDLWLPFIIGTFELAAYPVFLRLNAFELLGGWLALKTAGQWLGWQHSRTSFNRFLLANVINVFVAYFWLSKFIQPTCMSGSLIDFSLR